MESNKPSATRAMPHDGADSRVRRMIDLSLSFAGLVVLSPVIAVAAAGVWWDDGFPILFQQVRVGRGGIPFQLWKLRSMRTGGEGNLVTARNDARVTRLGKILRRYKLDEIPQLWNVLKGDMSFVGPRPEVPRYVNEADPVWRAVLTCRPGITDLATLLFRDEEDLLAGAAEPERHYRERILPAKLALNLEYLEKRTLFSDFKLILLTVRYSFLRSAFDADTVRRALLPH
jgi:lipopolysaccharide/colanic/teichoic acid biosynthesis glycosyltransferase